MWSLNLGNYIVRVFGSLRPLPTYAPGQLNVFWHDGDTLGVHGAEVRVLEQADKVRFGSFLERQQRWALESNVVFELVCDLADEPLERELANEKIGGFLVVPNLAQRDSSGSVAPGPPL